MKTCYFVRHAKATQQMFEFDDIDRPLIGRGCKDAHLMSKKLAQQKIKPQLLISSIGIRALSTAIIFARNLKINSSNLLLVEKLYNASVENVLEVLVEIPLEINEVMIFGHNPSITNVTHAFIPGFDEHLPTCGITCIDFDVNYWHELQFKSGKLRFFDHPKNND